MAFDNFWGFSAKHPDRLAVVEVDGRTVSQAEMLAGVNQLSRGLQSLGLARGDSIAAMLPNSREAIEVFLAMQQVGLYLTPINYHLVGPEIAYILQDCEARAFIVHAQYADACRSAVDETGFPPENVFIVGGPIAGFRGYDELKAGQLPGFPDNRTLGAVMNYTSGTTGRPKGVRRGLPETPIEETDLGVALYAYGVGREESDNVHLLACPWYHTAPLVMATPSLHLGHSLVIMDRFDALRALELIERYRVTITHLVPTQFVRLLALSDEERRRYDTSSLRHVIHGAAPCAPELKRRMIDWLGPVIDEYYASTEGVGGTIIFSDEWLAKPGSVGKARNDNRIVIMDDDGTILPAGQIGTIYSTGTNRGHFEYFKDPEKTARSQRGHEVDTPG